VFTEELVLNSVGEGPWRWTLGSMYRDAQDDSDQGDGRPLGRDVYHNESKSFAVFGELTRAFADGRYEVTGGLRYFRDKVRNWEDSRSGNPPDGIPSGGLLSPEDTFKKTTPRFVVTWHPSDDATLYASYSKGFRSGLIQGFPIIQSYPTLQAADPDTLTNYELGAKASTLGGRLNFDGAVYYIDWSDVQQSVTLFTASGPTPAFVNGDSASGLGVDLAVTYAPIESLTLGLNVGWNDLTFDSDVLESSGSVLYPKGSRRSNSPETTAGASVDYAIPLGGSGYRGRLSVSANYVAEQITGYSQTSAALVTADSVTLVRTGFTVEAPKHWTATLYVDNATNEEGIQPDTFAAQYDVVIRPRTYGVQLEYRY